MGGETTAGYIEQVADIKKHYQWLDRTGLKDNTKTLIMAAQKQEPKIRRLGLPHQAGSQVQALQGFP